MRPDTMRCRGRPGVAAPYPARPLIRSVRHHAAKQARIAASGRALLPGLARTFERNNGRAPVAPRAVAEEEMVLMDHSKTFKYGQGEFSITITVRELASGDQRVHLETDHPSKNLILHWGVQGGKNYKGGWRLPSQRPPDTVQYKERALQTSWQAASGTKKVLDIDLDGDEASEFINFVLKDSATNTWYDSNGSNFQMALVSTLRSFASIDDAEMSKDLFSLDEIPEIPSELAGIWSYIMWETAGCPDRSQEAADREYREGIAQLQACLMRGKTLDELWQVANGEVKYADFRKQFIDKQAAGGTKDEARKAAAEKPAEAAPPPPPPPPAKEEATESRVAVQEEFIPDDLIGIKAYHLWKDAGEPDGADFSPDAKQAIRRQMRDGASLEEIEKQLRAPAPELKEEPAAKQQQPQQQEEGAKEEESAPPPPKAEEEAPPAPKAEAAAVEVGDGVDVPLADPMALIKSGEVPVLSSEAKKTGESPLEFMVQAAAMDGNTRFRRLYRLDDGAELLAVAAQARPDDDVSDDGNVEITLTTDAKSSVVLHWGVGTPRDRSWRPPAAALQPDGSEAHEGGKAVETPFVSCSEAGACTPGTAEARVPLQQLQLTVPKDADVANVQFVLRSADHSKWYRDGASNFSVPAAARGGGGDAEAEEQPVVDDPLVREIIDAENTSAWTLMHRFNRAADLINDVLSGNYDDTAAAMASIFVWLRFSATRHLTWQRNYNTQPRILSAAQARCVDAITRAHGTTGGEAQEWVRLMLSSVGRGGDGQAIRDEILNIMHRNNISEKKGTWMEEWHQKLHNNTTPDDVPICEAYLAFLAGNGDNGAYWRVLSDAGISRERLESFDRPVRCEPEYFGHCREQLIKDFEHYLGILKAVHSGADLQNAAKNAGGQLPGSAKGHLGYVLASRGSNQILPLIQSAVACRTELHDKMTGNKDLLYLDLALEGVVRGAIERGVGNLDIGAAAFVGPLLQNLVLTAGDNEELCYCLKAWQALPRSVQYGAAPDTLAALQATAVVDRIRRALGGLSTSTSDRVEPVATAIGKSCGVESWAVELFSEEVVRAGPAFAVSLALSTVEPALRKCAELGAWQVISPANVTGRVVEVASLNEVQDKVYEEPTILLANRVSGEEEIPEGAVAVITPDAPDVLSHSSVRARNMKVLFATCHDEEPLQEIRAEAGKVLSFETTAAGTVAWSDGADATASAANNGAGGAGRPKLKIDIPKWCGKWAIGMAEYKDGRVGGKSKNLAALRGTLPDWISLPASVTLPFGCFEEALNVKENKAVKKAVNDAAKKVSKGAAATHLAECRDAVADMVLPKALREALAAQMEAAGIPRPESEERWAAADRAIIGVWASKFNDRAFYSMRKVGLNFMDLRMAVLVQRVVPARYAFVIHTTNPSTGNEDEIYCELVRGLGESLVSGMVPGSALSFVAPKADLSDPEILTFPSKSFGMFVPESLIFRSDSNGEDLAGYAGAGLYESITMDSTTLEIDDFSDDPILTDEAFRKKLLGRICEVGKAIEDSMGSAQDIEGVVDPDGNVTVVQTRPQV